MSRKITILLRELVAPVSIFLIIVGVLLIVFSSIWFFAQDIATDTSSPLQFIGSIENWNWYVMGGGLVIFGFGLYYLYSFMSKRRFLLNELKTNKRSELIKKDTKLKATVKRLPKKYQRMLQEKEDELHIE